MYFANKLWKYFEHSVHDLCTAPSAASIVFHSKIEYTFSDNACDVNALSCVISDEGQIL